MQRLGVLLELLSNKKHPLSKNNNNKATYFVWGQRPLTGAFTSIYARQALN
jgi:hypothetical protein